jgi:hypothetical protein
MALARAMGGTESDFKNYLGAQSSELPPATSTTAPDAQ